MYLYMQQISICEVFSVREAMAFAVGDPAERDYFFAPNAQGEKIF